MHRTTGISAFLLAGLLPACPAFAAAEVKTHKADWCTVTVPKQARPGDVLIATVRLTAPPAGTVLASDLHWNRTDGSWAGTMAWGGPAQPARAGKDHVFRLRVQAKEKLGSVTVLVYLSKTGKWSEHTHAVRVPVPVAAAPGQARTRRKSWIWIDASAGAKVLVEGEKWTVPVEYYLDANEDDGGTQMVVWAPGPWIDCPDGTYTKKRHHVGYPGTWKKFRPRPGRGREVLTFTVPPAKPRNALQLIAYFQDASGDRWPWEVRRGGMWFRRKGGFFELETDKPGNLFTYGEPVRILARLRNVAAGQAGKARTLSYAVIDTTGKSVATGELRFTPERDGQVVEIPLKLRRRGAFLIAVDSPGWEKRHTTFCRIPDVMAITKGRATRFGMTNVVAPGAPERAEALCRIARRIGLTTCRTFASWNQLEPGPGVYKLDDWLEAIETGSRQGIATWLCIVNPPAWVLTGEPKNIGYRAFACDWRAWEAFIRTATRKFRGELFGWEWLNEIVPGGSKAPAADYARFVRIGTEAVRSIDPNMKLLLAGGLWPRSFRLAVLKAGVGRNVDVLPVHYSTGPAVRQAIDDLQAAGCGKVEVWDNETARGISTWGAPPTFDMTHTLQSDWVMTHWPDELCAGCRRIIYFGGRGDAAGNWSYLYDDLSPRPVAATLAVLVSKLHGARPLGAVSVGRGALLHLFERDGRAVMVASSRAESETLRLPVGAERLTLTDAQGNERTLACAGGAAALPLGRRPVFVDGADLDVLKAQLVGSVVARAVSPAHRGALKDTAALAPAPRVTLLAGRAGEVLIRVRNLFESPLAGRFRIACPAGWPAPPETRFTVQPGGEKLLPVRLTPPADAAGAAQGLTVAFQFDRAKVPPVTRPFTVSVLSADRLGNLLPNGGFEEPAGTGAPAGWAGSESAARVPAKDLGDGLGRCALKFTDTKNAWAHFGRTIDLSGGQAYLYTAWIWNENMHAGSNHTQRLADGSVRNLYDVNVFTAGQDNGHWRLYCARIDAPAGMKNASFTPVCKGPGWALFDNLRVTVYEGTDYAAEAHRAARAPKIDGRLDDWHAAGLTRCPLPLLGRNQLTSRKPDEPWSPADLSAVGYLAWDPANLYVALRVRDDVHHAKATGEEAVQGDSLVLAIDPSNRRPGSGAKALAYYISAAVPGGGSGRHTLYRPKGRAGGGRWGQLARDSSLYELAVDASRRGLCTYELRIPLSELGGVTGGVGTKLGLSLLLNDNDGSGPAALMTWGNGLHPAWLPGRFGVLTMVVDRSSSRKSPG